MPLSDEEQKILREIEAQLNATDPDLVEQVSRTTIYRHASRNIKWAVAGFIAGLALAVLTFADNLLVAFLGFLVMLGCLFVIERNVRTMGRAGIREISGGMKPGGLKGVMSDTSRAWREKFRRNEP